ncbi:MAG: hypothetical protein QOD39_2435 [Mycobacterium sp.]|nr:hypothetical protein [Mycobacterium sp.]
MTALGLANQSGADPVTALSWFLASRHVLLVADNCERLASECARVFTALLSAAPALQILATSRAVLNVPGEHVFPLDPLSIPDSAGSVNTANFGSFSALALFAERAAAVRRGFQLDAGNLGEVTDLCRRLDGLPLAIELAAARLRLLSVDQLAARVESDDRFHLLTRGNTGGHPRHQTLRATMDWSAALLTPAERLLWERAAVFPGRFDMNAAVAVCAGGGLPAGKMFEALAGLIDKSVLTAAEDIGTRQYWMLETVREYALERGRDREPDGLDEAALRQRHRDYYAAMAERFHEHWFGPQQVRWTQQMRAALPNVRQALAYSLTTPGQEQVALRMAGRLDFFWSSCGVNQEGRLWLGRALAADHTPGPDRARALASYVRVLTSQSMHADAAGAAQESVDLARRFDEALVPAALTGCGLNMVHLGQLSEGISLLDEAIARARSDADQPLVLVVALVYRCFVLTAEGRMADVAELLTECQSICRRHGDSAMLTYALTMSVPPLLESGEVVRAAALAGEALPLAAAMHDNLGLTLSFEMMAWCASAQGDHRRAACLFGAAALQVTMNGGSPFDVGPYHDARRPFETTSRSALGDAAFEAEARRGERMPLDQAVAYALTGDHRPVSADRPASPARAGKPVLTPREREVAELVAQGLTNKQIGARLFITHRTAEGHIENIFVKLGVTSRTQLAARLSQRAQPHDGTPPEPGADHGLG